MGYGKRLNHEKMIVWKAADKLDIIVQEILEGIPRSEYRLKAQIDTASDSIGSNFVEGYYSGSLNEYVRFLRYSRRSCGELQERTRRAYRKRLVVSSLYNKFSQQVIRTGYLFDQLIMVLESKKERKELNDKRQRGVRRWKK